MNKVTWEFVPLGVRLIYIAVASSKAAFFLWLTNRTWKARGLPGSRRMPIAFSGAMYCSIIVGLSRALVYLSLPSLGGLMTGAQMSDLVVSHEYVDGLSIAAFICFGIGIYQCFGKRGGGSVAWRQRRDETSALDSLLAARPRAVESLDQTHHRVVKATT